MANNGKTRDFLSGTVKQSHSGGTEKREKSRRPGMRAVASLVAAAALMFTTAIATPAFANENQVNAPVAAEQTVQEESKYIVEVTPDTFVQEVVEGSKDQTVIFFMYTSDCDDCARFGDAIEAAVKAGNQGDVKFAKMNLDDPNNAMWAMMNFGIQGVPTTAFFAHGYFLQAMAGAPPAGQEAEVANQWVAVSAEVHKEVGDQIKAMEAEEAGNDNKSSLRMQQKGPRLN